MSCRPSLPPFASRSSPSRCNSRISGIKVKVSRVEAFLMSHPFAEPLRLPFWAGERTILKRDAMLIRIQADNGLAGYAPGPAHERAAREIRDVIGPWLAGKDPRQ